MSLRRSWSMITQACSSCSSVVGGAADADFARCQEAVTARGAADRDALKREWQDVAVIEADDRGQRPHPAQRRARPAHRFRPGQLDDRGLDQLRQHFGRGPAGAPDNREIEFAAPGVADLAFRDRAEPGRAQEPLDRLRRRADPRPAPFLAAVGLGRRNALGDDRQPARRHIAAHTRGRDLGRGELVAHQPSEILDGAALHPRRDFLRQELDQQFAPVRLPGRRHFTVDPKCAIVPPRFPGESRDPPLAWIPACAGNARKTGLCDTADGRPANLLGLTAFIDRGSLPPRRRARPRSSPWPAPAPAGYRRRVR